MRPSITTLFGILLFSLIAFAVSGGIKNLVASKDHRYSEIKSSIAVVRHALEDRVALRDRINR